MSVLHTLPQQGHLNGALKKMSRNLVAWKKPKTGNFNLRNCYNWVNCAKEALGLISVFKKMIQANLSRPLM